MSRYRLSIVVLGLLLAGRPLVAAEFFVSPTGTDRGKGSQKAPWSLTKALSHPGVVKPGDTIWLRDGTYTGNFTSYLRGTASLPIKVRQHLGERATLDGNVNPAVRGNGGDALTINGGYTWFWGFEVTNSNTDRWNPVPGSFNTDARNGGINVFGTGTKIINVVIHDTGEGISFWSPATNAELYGNIIYYNGWNSTDRGHGHGIYAQNYQGGSKLIKHNILLAPAFDGCFNMQAYGSSAAGFQNSTIDGNVSTRAPIMAGGLSGFLFTNDAFTNNYTWDGPATIGYWANDCTGTTVTGNYCVNVGVSSSFAMPWSSLAWPPNAAAPSMTGNTFIGDQDNGSTSTYYPTNTYIAKASPPTVNKVAILPNAYEPGRANIIIYNWQKLSSVSIDLSSVVSPGAAYEIRNAQNFYGPPVVSGTYVGGSVTLPMTGLTPATPVGLAAPSSTGPAFGAFVVLSGQSGSPSPLVPPTASFTYSPAAPTANAPVTFTDTSTGSPTTWQWSFGDGSTSTQRNPTHTYAGAGTYTVTLTAANGAGSNQTSRSLGVTVRSNSPTPTRFYTVSPCRVIDTRKANGPTGGPILAANAVRIFPVAGLCGIPADARTVSANLTVMGGSAPGALRVYPTDTGIPVSSAISFRAGQTRSNIAITTLATDGTGTIGVKNDAPGTLHLILDVSGYFK